MDLFVRLLGCIVLSALVALLGKNRSIGYGLSFLTCLFLSPCLGLIIILCCKKKGTEFVSAENGSNEKGGEQL